MAHKKKKKRFERGHKSTNKYARNSKVRDQLKTTTESNVDKGIKQEADSFYTSSIRLYRRDLSKFYIPEPKGFKIKRRKKNVK